MSPTVEYRPLLDFWFTGDSLGRWRALGAIHEPAWRPVADADADARQRFHHLVDHMANGDLELWLADPRGRLSYILVADTLPRSFYRGTSRAYALDGRALQAAIAGISAGIDRRMAPIERAFFYMPFTHAEPADWSRAQERSVDCYRALRDEYSGSAEERDLLPIFEGFLQSAERHAAIIHRFGRFPHRNALLHRESTPDERIYLDDPWNYDLCSKMTPKTK